MWGVLVWSVLRSMYCLIRRSINPQLTISNTSTPHSMKLSALKPNEDNPRKIDDKKLQKLINSLKEFPKMMELRPIIIDADSVILGGNMRYLALKELGYKNIPDEWVKRADTLTEEEKERFIIADNVGFGEWDWDLLTEDWDVDKLENWGLKKPDIQIKEEKDAVDDGFKVNLKIQTDIVPGDMFQIGDHRLLCGDCTDIETVERLMGDRKADLVVTDPPYNVDYTGKTQEALKIDNDSMNDESFYQFLYDAYVSMFYASREGCPIYVFHSDHESLNFIKAMKDGGWKQSQILIWVKNSMVMGRKDYHTQHEPILYGWKEGAAHPWHTDRKQTTILNFDRPSRSKEHPTMKPIELLSYLTKNSSKPKDTVVDLFGGSGSTMVTGHQLDRSVYMMEIDPIYCQVIIDRMKKLDPNLIITKIDPPKAQIDPK